MSVSHINIIASLLVNNLGKYYWGSPEIKSLCSEIWNKLPPSEKKVVVRCMIEKNKIEETQWESQSKFFNLVEVIHESL